MAGQEQVKEKELGRNVLVSETKDEIIVRINKKSPRWASKTGKSDMIASTMGNQEFVTDEKEIIKIGVNIYTR